MRLTMNKKAFLENGSDKQALIQLLAAEMVKEGISVEHAVGDADYKICKLACLSAAEKPTAVIAEDTDVFQLLTHHVDVSASNLYMITAKHTVCISTLKKKLDPHLSKSILFLHAVSGCDTTSKPYGIGKVGVLQKCKALEDSTSVFMSPSSSKEDIVNAGESALLVMYGCPTSPHLSTARLEKFQVKVVTSAGYVPPEKLPPTTDAAAFHSQRTYHQVQAWCGNDLPAEDWGWVSSSDGLVPIKMSQPAAPEQLLRTIRCNCGGNCDKRSCTCYKNALQCTSACGQCKGIACLSGPEVERQDYDNDDDGDAE